MRLLLVSAVVVGFAALALGADDSLLATAVHEALAKDRRVDAQQVRVEAADGAVKLLGQVDTNEEREAAASIASRVPGVRRVDNELSIAMKVAPAPGSSPIPERMK